MPYTALPADEKTHLRHSRDLSRERRNAERARAARPMLLERRRRQSGSSLELTDDMTAKTDAINAPT